MRHNRTFVVSSWLLRIVAALLLFQTLFFKFTGARESVYIFTTVGQWTGLSFMEPWGRIGTGLAELAACVLLLWPRTVAFGAMLSLAVISGAIFFHLTALGIALPAVEDQGELFALAVIVFAASAALLAMHRHELPRIRRVGIKPELAG
jgi:hypothetical protein